MKRLNFPNHLFKSVLKTFLTGITLIAVLNACGPDEKKGEGESESESGAANKEFYWLKYSKDSVDAALGKPTFTKLIAQFYSPVLPMKTKDVHLIAYEVNLDMSTCKYTYLQKRLEGGTTWVKYPDTLFQVKDSIVRIEGPAVFGNLEITREQLIKATTHQDGAPKDYDWLYCKPVKHAANHIYYMVFATKNGRIVPPKPNQNDEDSDLNPRPPAD